MRQYRISQNFKKADLPLLNQKAHAKPSKEMEQKIRGSTTLIKNQRTSGRPIANDENQSVMLNYQNSETTPPYFSQFMIPLKHNRQSGKVLERYKTDVSQLKEGKKITMGYIKNISYGVHGIYHNIYKKFFSFLKKAPYWVKDENVSSFIEQRAQPDRIITQEKGKKLSIDKNIGFNDELLQGLEERLLEGKEKISMDMDSNMLIDSRGRQSFLISMWFKNGEGHAEDVENNWYVKDNGNEDAMDCVSRAILRLTSNNLLPLFESALDEAQKDKAYWESLWQGYEQQVTAKVFDKKERVLSPQELKEVCRKIKNVVEFYTQTKSKETFEDFIRHVNTQFQNSQKARRGISTPDQNYLSLHEWRSAINFVRALIVKETLDSGEVTYTHSGIVATVRGTPSTKPIVDHLDTLEAYNPSEPSFSKKLQYGIVYKSWRRFNKLLAPVDMTNKEARRKSETTYQKMPTPIASKERFAKRVALFGETTPNLLLKELQDYDIKHETHWREIFPISIALTKDNHRSYMSFREGKEGDLAFEEIIDGHPIRHRHKNIENTSPAQIEGIYKKEVACSLLTNLLILHFSLGTNDINPDFGQHLFQGKESLAGEIYKSLLTYAAQKREEPFEDYLAKEKGQQFLSSYDSLIQTLAFQLDSRNENRPNPKISSPAPQVNQRRARP